VRAVVVGAGAVGSFLGATLALGGVEVTLVRRRSRSRATAGVELLRRPRLGAGEVALRGADDLADLAPPDVVLFAVKQPDLPGALATAAAWPTATGVTVQNGIGAEETARAARPDAGLVAASLTASVDRRDARRIAVLRRGGIGLAAVRAGAGADARYALVPDLATAFQAGGLASRVLDDAAAMKWSKLLANLVGNATSALVDLEPADVYADPGLFGIERRQLLEGLAVMGALGLAPVALPGADVRALMLAFRFPPGLGQPILSRVVRFARGGKSPSLRLHLASGPGPLPQTEVAWLNGAVTAAGERLGVATPVNAALARLVDEAASDPAFRASLRARPDRLVALIG
jgi:2-dehydropantoate 2-reductase